MKKLTQEELKENLHYEPASGVFTWVKAKRNNSINVGDIAGCLDKYTGYMRIKINGRNYQAHRLAFLYMTGKFPVEQVDHINHDRSDNRFVNLRKVTRLENSRNKSMQSNNTSGFTGVSWQKGASKWLASISINGKRKHLGIFKDINDAIACRKRANVEFGYHANHG